VQEARAQGGGDSGKRAECGWRVVLYCALRAPATAVHTTVRGVRTRVRLETRVLRVGERTEEAVADRILLRQFAVQLNFQSRSVGYVAAVDVEQR
jgi:hypothetical protein